MPKPSPAATRPLRVPSYCHHRASNQAYVKVRGKVTYLGVYGSDASRNAYAQAVADVLAGRSITKPRTSRGAGREKDPHKIGVRSARPEIGA